MCRRHGLQSEQATAHGWRDWILPLRRRRERTALAIACHAALHEELRNYYVAN